MMSLQLLAMLVTESCQRATQCPISLAASPVRVRPRLASRLDGLRLRRLPAMGSLQHPPEPMLVVRPTDLLACVGAWVLPRETLVGVAGGVPTPIGGLILSPSILGGSMECCSRVKMQPSLCGLVVYWRRRCSCSRWCRWRHHLFCALTTPEGILLREALEPLPDQSSLLTGSSEVHRRSSVQLLRVQRPWMRLLRLPGCR